MTTAVPSAVLLASETEIPSGRVWGSGGWVQPEDREALDWLTLLRLLGWPPRIICPDRAGEPAESFPARANLIVVGCDPDALSERVVARISGYLQAGPSLVISRAPSSGSALAAIAAAVLADGAVHGSSIEWIGPGPAQRWHLGGESTGRRLAPRKEAKVWAAVHGEPIVAARAHGRGIFASLGCHPSVLRDVDPAGSAVIKKVLTWGFPDATAWLDFENTLVLRMDDPGGAQNIYSRTWNYPKLTSDSWDEVGRDLASRDARLSIGYVSGWVDDGDEIRGRLTVRGRPVSRRPGSVYPSPVIRYEDIAGHSPGAVSDYTSEFRGIQALRAASIADVELHGYTHMHPDLHAWLSAPNRFESEPDAPWYRELGRPALAALEKLPADEYPLACAVRLFREFFAITPTTLICPGEQFTDAAVERALDLDLRLVGSYYLAIRHDGRFCWTQHVCAPYLHLPDPAWFHSGLPVVGYFHDYELATQGVGWMSRWLDRWQAAGASRLIDFRELAAALDTRVSLDGRTRLVVDRAHAVPAVRPIPIRVRTAAGVPETIRVTVVGGSERRLDVIPRGDGTGVVCV